jgi:hypothetical protein
VLTELNCVMLLPLQVSGLALPLSILVALYEQVGTLDNEYSQLQDSTRCCFELLPTLGNLELRLHVTTLQIVLELLESVFLSLNTGLNAAAQEEALH